MVAEQAGARGKLLLGSVEDGQSKNNHVRCGPAIEDVGDSKNS